MSVDQLNHADRVNQVAEAKTSLAPESNIAEQLRTGVDFIQGAKAGSPHESNVGLPQTSDKNARMVDLNAPIYPQDQNVPITSPAQIGLENYPTNNDARQQDNARLDNLDKQLPANSFSSVMLKDMQQLGLDNVDIWFGSNVQLNGEPADGGALYRKWNQLPGVTPRESSHPHIGQEYQIPTGDGSSALLFGVDPQGNTFFQVEHNFAGGATGVAHMQDYQLYKSLSQNVGAEGVSPHTDKNPIVLS